MKIKSLLMGSMTVMLWLNITAMSHAAINGENEVKKPETSKAAVDGKSSTAANTSDNEPKPSAEEQIFLLNEKVRRLEEIVERQQKMIESLQPKPAGEIVPTAAPAVVSSTQPAQAPADEHTKKLDSLYKAFGQFNISGDLRFRYDGQFNQGFDSPLSAPDRNRLRVRTRLQLAGQFHDNFDWAIRVASGSFTNPLSTNQTATDFFNRKPIGLDRYFIRYNSKTEPYGVILQAGKFDYPWKRTELTFDNDLQPEGAAETLYFKGKNFLKEAKLIAFQIPFNEVAAGKDSVLYGGQLQSTLGSGSWAFIGSATFLNFNQVDAIARALNRPTTQVGGGLEFGTTNRVRVDAAGNILGFVTNYNILDIIGEVRYSGNTRFPISLLFNYARNMSDRLEKLKERNAYWAEFRVGQLKERGDVELSYTFDRVERDAVLSVFNFDDFLATNSRNNRITFGYTFNSNVFVQFIGLFSQRFNTLPGRDSRIQKRFQFDVNYRF